MKILLVNDYATATAGAERLTLDVRDELRERGHRVRVFASRAQLGPGDSFADATCFGTTSRVQTLSSTLNLSARAALARELRSFAPDLVQVHMFLWQLSPAILALLRDVPAIYWAMTYKPVCPTGLKWLPHGARCDLRAGTACIAHGCLNATGFGPLMLQRRLWRRGRAALDTIISVSESVRGELEADGIVSSKVISPGTRPLSRRPPLGGAPTVTCAGRLTPEKGVDVLVRAFVRVRERLPDARLLIAGTGPQEMSLRELVKELGLAPAVEIAGQIDGDRLHAMLDRAWVHAVPSRWPEPFGLTATEAMMRGTAVVASDVGGLADIVDHEQTGLRVPPGHVIALTDALLRLLSDRASAERMGAAGYERARRLFSLNQCVSELEAVYDEIVPRAREPMHAR